MQKTGRAMTEPRRLVEQTEGEEYLHKEVWRVVQRQLDYAEVNPHGALYDDLVAMVFAFHAMEGYLNYVGEKITPDQWHNEKAQFSESGLTGKLTAICARCGLTSPDYGKRPYGTLSEVKKLRNAMAHPRTRKTGGTVEYDEQNPPPLFPRSYLSKMVSHQRALRVRDDVKCIADQIHAAARGKFPEAGLGPNALDGMMSLQTGSTRVSDLS
jgi:hypothetical protein